MYCTVWASRSRDGRSKTKGNEVYPTLNTIREPERCPHTACQLHVYPPPGGSMQAIPYPALLSLSPHNPSKTKQIVIYPPLEDHV